jgi:putative hemolysin
VLATTYLSLVIGELVPKQIALNNREQIASIMSRPMSVISRVMSPVVMLLMASSDLMLRLLGSKPANDPPITPEEITLLVRQGMLEGVFEPVEHEMISRILRLDQRKTVSIMTPRPDIEWIDLHDDPARDWREVLASGYSYFPVCEKDIDHAIGIVSARQLLLHMLDGNETNIQGLIHPVQYIPENAPLLRLVRLFKETGQQMAFVLGEHGGVEGLVTMKDFVEAIMGELPSGGDTKDEPDIVLRDDGSWLVDGALPLDRFRELFEIAEPSPGEQRGLFNTIGGYIMAEMERIPKVSDTVHWHGYRIEVMDMDGLRVDKVLVSGPERKE